MKKYIHQQRILVIIEAMHEPYQSVCDTLRRETQNYKELRV